MSADGADTGPLELDKADGQDEPPYTRLYLDSDWVGRIEGGRPSPERSAMYVEDGARNISSVGGDVLDDEWCPAGEAEQVDPDRTRHEDDAGERRGFLGSGWRSESDESGASRPKRHQGGLIIVAAVAVLGMALAGVWLLSGSGDPPSIADGRSPASVLDSGSPDRSVSETTGRPTGEPTVEPTVISTGTPAPSVAKPSASVGPAQATRRPARTARPRSSVTTSRPTPPDSTLSGETDLQETIAPVEDSGQTRNPQQTSAPEFDDSGNGGNGNGGGKGNGNGGGGGLLDWLFGR
ncbi:MAG TPA: hypothetical protein VIR33_04195 [Thermopolyspora sp.]